MPIKKTYSSSIFIEILGDTPKIRILDYLIEGRDLDYSLSDIAQNAHIGWTTVHRLLPNMLKTGVILPTREIGRAKLYKINKDNKAVSQLIKLYDSLLRAQADLHARQNSYAQKSYPLAMKCGKTH